MQAEPLHGVALLGQLGALASIRPREKSSISRPWTISQLPLLVVTGKEEIRPSGTPYEPSEQTAIDSQLPSGLPPSQSRVWSIVADAADAADDAPGPR